MCFHCANFPAIPLFMKQTFSIRGGAAIGRQNLPTLRQKMTDTGLDFLYVPHEDEYNNESVSYTHLTLPTKA